MNHLDASVAVSISQLSFLITAPLACAFMNEPITRKMSVGMGFAAFCIVLFYLGQ